MRGGCGEMPICQPSGGEMNQNVRISREKDLYFFNQISRYRRQPWRASVSRAREIQSRKVMTNRAFFRRPMGGCERGAAAVALMLRRWVCARAMCPRSPLAAGAGSLGLCAGVGLAGGGDGVGWRGVGLECACALRLLLPHPCVVSVGWWGYQGVVRTALPSCVYKCCYI